MLELAVAQRLQQRQRGRIGCAGERGDGLQLRGVSSVGELGDDLRVERPMPLRATAPTRASRASSTRSAEIIEADDQDQYPVWDVAAGIRGQRGRPAGNAPLSPCSAPLAYAFCFFSLPAMNGLHG